VWKKQWGLEERERRVESRTWDTGVHPEDIHFSLQKTKETVR
jgi:hypothetical protein